MVGGDGDDEDRDDGVARAEVAPRAARERPRVPGDDHRPRDVHRWHRRELVERVRPDRGGVDRRAVPGAGVDEAEAREHPRRCHRDELDQEAGEGRRHERGPGQRVERRLRKKSQTVVCLAQLVLPAKRDLRTESALVLFLVAISRPGR